MRESDNCDASLLKHINASLFRSSFSFSSLPGGGDGVEAHRVGLAVLGINPRGDHTIRLALPVGHVTSMVNDDVAHLTRGVGT